MRAIESEDYDSPWKNITESFFDRFMAFFFPKAHKLIDWDLSIDFLDMELQKITPPDPRLDHTVEKLVRVGLKKGGDVCVVIHIDPVSAKRVFVCNYRIYERYKLPVASLVILTDSMAVNGSNKFSSSAFGSEINLSFPVIKLLDFTQDEKRLLRNTNPWALVTLAYLKSLNAGISKQAQRIAKLELVPLLRKRKESIEEVVDLMRFIDWQFSLPQDIEKELREIIQKEDKKMHTIPFKLGKNGDERGQAGRN